jgi:hypothetical protein
MISKIYNPKPKPIIYKQQKKQMKFFKRLFDKKGLVKGRECCICGEPDDYSDECICGKCIQKWKGVIKKKARAELIDDILEIIENDYFSKQSIIKQIKQLKNDNAYKP